jgi:hypothetical protein
MNNIKRNEGSKNNYEICVKMITGKGSNYRIKIKMCILTLKKKYCILRCKNNNLVVPYISLTLFTLDAIILRL